MVESPEKILDVFEGILRGLETSKARVLMKKQEMESPVQEEMNDPQSTYLGWPQVIKPYMDSLVDLSVVDQNIINEYKKVVESLQQYTEEYISREREFTNAEQIVSEATVNIDHLEAEVSRLKDIVAAKDERVTQLEYHVPRELVALTKELEQEDPRALAIRKVNFYQVKYSEDPFKALEGLMKKDLVSKHWPREIDFLPSREGLLDGIHPPETDEQRMVIERALKNIPDSDWESELLKPRKRYTPTHNDKLPRYWQVCNECYIAFFDEVGQAKRKGGAPEKYRPPKRCKICTHRLNYIKKWNEEQPSKKLFIEPLTGLKIDLFEKHFGPPGANIPSISYDETVFAKHFHPNGPGAIDALRAAASDVAISSEEVENHS